ncbi:snoRNA-binding rRNA-processing protein utp10, partial [Coemansia erecta]
ELGSRLIPSLPQYLPSALKHLHAVVSKYKSANADDLALMISALSAMQAIVENMSAFLAPSLPPLFACLFNPSLRVPASTDDGNMDDSSSSSSSDDVSDAGSADSTSPAKRSKKPGSGDGNIVLLREQANKLVDDVLLALAKNIPARQLIPAQFTFYQKEASKLGTAILVPFVDFVGKTGGLLQSNTLIQFYKPLFKLFLSVFDLARNPAIPLSDIELLEQATLDAFMRFVVKLNENLFKPLFLSFVDWATAEPSALPAPQNLGGWISSASASPVAKSRHGRKDDKRARQQNALEARLRVFYRVLNVLFDKLKSILTPYYSSVIDTTVAQLDRFGIAHDTIEAQEEEDRMEKPVPSALWCAVVESIHQSALHDTSGFWSDAMFKKVLRPLANQLPNTKALRREVAMPGEQEYEQYIERVRKYLAPAVSQLSVAVGDDAMWKQLNQAVMLRSRSDEPAVRVGSLLVLQALYERLGEEYLILLPETIPYLAELLEDDDSRVERATQETIKVIESYLGESMGAKSEETTQKLTVWQKAFLRDEDWKKDELREVVFWLIEAFSAALGLCFGVLGLHGLLCFIVYFASVVAVPSVYFTAFLGVDEQDYGGKMEILGDSVGAGAATFVLAWIGSYTVLYDMSNASNSGSDDPLHITLVKYESGLGVPGIMPPKLSST